MKTQSVFKYKAKQYYVLSLIRNNPAEAFKLHGLWPQFETGYPSYCGSFDRMLVDAGDIGLQFKKLLPQLLNQWACRPQEPPARSLQFWLHEYTKHGTCMFKEFTLANYFETCLRLYRDAKNHSQIRAVMETANNSLLIPLNLELQFELQR